MRYSRLCVYRLYYSGSLVYSLNHVCIADDIAVRFVEQDDDGHTVWEAYGNFGPFDVHRQVISLLILMNNFIQPNTCYIYNGFSDFITIF